MLFEALWSDLLYLYIVRICLAVLSTVQALPVVYFKLTSLKETF